MAVNVTSAAGVVDLSRRYPLLVPPLSSLVTCLLANFFTTAFLKLLFEKVSLSLPGLCLW